MGRRPLDGRPRHPTGTRTRDNHILRELAPGMGLGELLGVRVEEFGRIAPPGADGLFGKMAKPWGFGPDAAPPPATSTQRPQSIRFGNATFRAAHLYEKLVTAPDVEPLAAWADRWLEGEAVLTRRAIGKGAGHYLGTYMTEELAERLIEQVFAPAGIQPLLPVLPEGVEVTERTAADGSRLLFVLNPDHLPVEFPLDGTMTDLLTGETPKGTARLEGYGAMVLSG